MSSILTHTFDGHPVHTADLDGRPCWAARNIGRHFGYPTGGRRLITDVLGAWAPEFLEDFDVAWLAGEALVRFQADVAGTPLAAVTTDPQGVLLFFEPGSSLLASRVKTVTASRFKHFLATEVLPELAGGGEVAEVPDMRAVGGAPSWVAPGASFAETREARLALQAHNRDRWVRLCEQRLKVGALHRLLDRTGGSLPAEFRTALEFTAVELALGPLLERRAPPGAWDGWARSEELARVLRLPRSEIDRAVDGLGLRGDPRFSRIVCRIAAGLRVFGFEFNAAAQRHILRWLRGGDTTPVA